MRRPAVLRSGGFRYLLLGQAVSSFGAWMGTFALMALIKELTGSDAAVGAILVLRLVPSGLAGPVAARLASGLDRKRTMLAMDLARAAMMAVVPFVAAAWWVYLWAFLTELASLVFLPARDAAVPDLVDEADLTRANGLVLASSYANIPVGGAAFALCYFLGGVALPIWVNAATFVVSYGLLTRLPDLGRPSDPDGIAVDVEGPVRFREGFRLPVVRSIMPAALTVFVGIGALFALGIPFVNDVLGATTVAFGYLVSLFGVGAVAGLVLAQRGRSPPGLASIRAGVVVLGADLATMSLIPLLWSAYLAAVVFGAAATYSLVGAITYLQQRLDGRARVLGFAVFHVVLRVGMSLAAVAAGLAADMIGEVSLPGVGRHHPAAAVLFAAGLVVLAGGALLQRPAVGAKDVDHGGQDRRRQRGGTPT